MRLRRYLAILVRWWWLLLLGVALAGGGAYLVTRTLPPVYRVTALLFVGQTETTGAVTYNDVLLNQMLAKTYSQMAVQPIVMDEVQQRLQLPMSSAAVGRMVTVRPIRDTQLLDIVVEGSDPGLVRDVANSVAEVFIEQQAPYLSLGQSVSPLRVAQPALLPTVPVGPRTLLNVALAGIFGLLLAAATVALLEHLDDTIKTPEDLTQATALASLGTVGRLAGRDGGPSGILSPTNLRGPAWEAYRLIRTNLEFASMDRPLRTLLITSAVPNEGKSTTAVNLGMALAQADKRVILVDADLRKPSLHRLLSLSNRSGLTNLLLADTADLSGHLQQCSRVGLWALPSGPLPPNPAELLGSPRLATLLERLKDKADVVVIDCTPILTLSDALALAGHVDGTLLVVDASRTRPEMVRRASEALAKSGTRLLGAVLNKVAKQPGGYYQYYYGADDDPNGATSGLGSQTEEAQRG